VEDSSPGAAAIGRIRPNRQGVLASCRLCSWSKEMCVCGYRFHCCDYFLVVVVFRTNFSNQLYSATLLQHPVLLLVRHLVQDQHPGLPTGCRSRLLAKPTATMGRARALTLVGMQPLVIWPHVMTKDTRSWSRMEQPSHATSSTSATCSMGLLLTHVVFSTIGGTGALSQVSPTLFARTLEVHASPMVPENSQRITAGISRNFARNQNLHLLCHVWITYRFMMM
jgi:hypothetical protein